MLSLPTKEYFQSSGWVEERSFSLQKPVTSRRPRGTTTPTEVLSVRSGSEFWAGPRSHTPSSSAFFSAADNSNDSGQSHLTSSPNRRTRSRGRNRGRASADDDDDNDSQGTEVPGKDDDDDIVDEVGAQDAFIAGMIYALSRRITPGAPYTPSWAGGNSDGSSPEVERGRWRLDECLR